MEPLRGSEQPFLSDQRHQWAFSHLGGLNWISRTLLRAFFEHMLGPTALSREGGRGPATHLSIPGQGDIVRLGALWFALFHA